MVGQLEFLKKQFKAVHEMHVNTNELADHMKTTEAKKTKQALDQAGLDVENYKAKFPSFRFSEEIVYMVSIIH